MDSTARGMSGIHTALDLSFTHTEGRWARPGSWVGRDFPDVRMFQEIAVTAERAGIDMLFFGDGSGIPDTWRIRTSGKSRPTPGAARSPPPWNGASSGHGRT